jgi:streptogramin lyase
MRTHVVRTTLLAVLIIGSLSTAPALTQNGEGGGTLTGTVKAADGTAMEGVVVSARSADHTWTTSVYSDARGQYKFPPMSAGPYAVWAQAKGHAVAKANANLAHGGAVTDMRLEPLTDAKVIGRQLDGPEWFAALREATNDDRRMKHLLRNNCTACHGPAYTLAPRFDTNGWRNIIDVMARGIPPTRGPGEGNRTWQAYKDDLAEYLGRVSKDMQPKPGPRPTGAATRVVITEFDIPRQGRPLSAHTGTFWTDGPGNRWESKGARDIWVDSKGNLWVSDDRSMGRTTGRLDPRTGKWTDYALPDAKGIATNSHGIWGDRRTDMIFQGGQPDGAILAFDTRAEEFVHFARPSALPGGGGHIDVDSEGNAWSPAEAGALRLNPKTGEYTYFPVPYPDDVPVSNRNQYGLGVDAHDNVWIARAGLEAVAWLNPKTGETGHVRFDPLPTPILTDKDRSMPVGMNFGPPNGRGPRRLGAGGRNGGNFMWVALNKSDELAKIDVRTKQLVKAYPMPQGSAPYFATVDKNGNVWVPAQNADRIYKLDPRTEQMTEFQLPTRGTDLRHLTIDDSTPTPTIWVTYNRSNKIARLQER